MNPTRSTVSLLCAALLLVAAPARALSIAVNFYEETADTIASVGMAGPLPFRQAFWNNAGGAGTGASGTASFLQWSDGAITPADITWSGGGPGYGTALFTPTTFDARMFMHGLYTTVGPLSVTMTNLSFPAYDLVVYFEMGAPSDRVYRFVATTSLESRTLFARDSSATFPNGGGFASYVEVPDTSTVDLGASTPAGHYVVFRALEGSSFTLDIFPGSIGGYGSITGLQVVERAPLDTDEDGIQDSLDPDDDNDGLTDVAESGLGTDRLDADSDDDGISDGAEVLVYITNPLDPDHDDDGDLDGADNCPAVANGAQQNGDGLPAGDACQCGDVTGEGIVNATDLLRAREHAVDRTPSGAFDPARCDVAPGGVCDLADLAVLERYLAAAPVGVANVCDAYLGP